MASNPPDSTIVAGNSTIEVYAKNDNTGDIVAIVALIISIIAFAATLLQVLQQYFASALGYSKCQKPAMGVWAKETKRKLRPFELRFEVQFVVPVIFLAQANYRGDGPVFGAELLRIEGTKENREKTWTPLPEEALKHEKERSKKELIHTADNEKATWVTLLSVLQQMESQSKIWEDRLFYDHPPPTKDRSNFESRTLTIFMQRKLKSWDTMPGSLSKPYATTTICHLVELVAILGLHWKVFNREADRYRAEGNGFILAGSNNSEIGLVFNFLRSGRTSFEADRIIPCGEVKMLCFGFVPTIFCTPEDEDHLKFPFEEPIDWTALQLGSRSDIAETLIIMGCNTNTSNYFAGPTSGRTSHLFPFTFELMGMLGRTLHIKHSGFRMLPNPSMFHWDKKSFSLWKIFREFSNFLGEMEGPYQTDQIAVLREQLAGIKHAYKLLRADFAIGWLDRLHSAIDTADAYICHPTVPKDVVYHVIRSHIQEVLGQLNDSDEDGDKPFDKLDALPTEQKQYEFMRIYFDIIRPNVVEDNPLPRRGTTWHPAHTNIQSGSSLTPGSMVNGDDSGSFISQEHISSTRITDPGELENQRNNIWCTLMFRMLCWLLLHDFHKKDVQVSKSELLGSRIPVYIV